jgi:hypothetical protein
MQMLLVLMAMLAMPPWGIAQEKPAIRTLWVFEGGWYTKTKDGWQRYDEKTLRTTNKPAKFGEAKVTNDFIDLYDESTRTYVRLYSRYAEILDKKGNWVKIATGQWKTPE